MTRGKGFGASENTMVEIDNLSKRNRTAILDIDNGELHVSVIS